MRRGNRCRAAKGARGVLLTLCVLVSSADRGGTSPLRAQDERRAKPAERDERRPSFVFLLMDDLRWDTLGTAGHPIVRTPNIDRLARGGATFSSSFCTTSICYASRATFLTGQYERCHRVTDFRTPLPDEAFARTFPALLRKNGYRVGFVGKWGLGGPLPEKEYDYWKGFSGQGRYYEKGREEHMTDLIGRHALEFFDGASREKPFCLQVSFKAAHCQDGDPWPFQPARRYQDLYEDSTVPLPETATGEHFEALPAFVRTSEARARWNIRFRTPELYQKSVKDYLRLITGVDDVVGRLVAKLEDEGLASDTIVIFSSDNGFYLGERGLAGKWFMHEESLRIPLLIHDPRLPESLRGREIDSMVLNIDLAPTILDLAGIAPPGGPRGMQGRSLGPLIRGESVSWRDDFFYEHLFEHRRIPKCEGVRTERWKYVRWVETEPLHEELFDLVEDPAETRNLAGEPEHREKLEDLRARCDRLAEELRCPVTSSGRREARTRDPRAGTRDPDPRGRGARRAR